MLGSELGKADVLGFNDNKVDGLVECNDDGIIEGGSLETFCGSEEGALVPFPISPLDDSDGSLLGTFVTNIPGEREGSSLDSIEDTIFTFVNEYTDFKSCGYGFMQYAKSCYIPSGEKVGSLPWSSVGFAEESCKDGSTENFVLGVKLGPAE